MRQFVKCGSVLRTPGNCRSYTFSNGPSLGMLVDLVLLVKITLKDAKRHFTSFNLFNKFENLVNCITKKKMVSWVQQVAFYTGIVVI
jgi:hypothetical protein